MITSRYEDMDVIGVRTAPGNVASRINIPIQMMFDITDVFGFVHAGDLLYPTKIESSLKPLEQNPNVMVVVSDRDGPDGMREYLSSYSADRMVARMEYDLSMLVRKAAFARMQAFFDPTMDKCEHYELLIRISRFGMIYHVPEALHQVTEPEQDTERWEALSRHG